MVEGLKPVGYKEGLLRLNKHDFDALHDYIDHLSEQYPNKKLKAEFFRYKDKPGLICHCYIDGEKIGAIQLVADREGREE